MEGYRLKSATGKGTEGESQAQTFGCPVPVVRQMLLTSPSMDGWQQVESIATQGSPPEPWCPGFLLRVHHIDMTDHPHGVHGPPEVKLSWYHMAKAVILNHTVSIDYLV